MTAASTSDTTFSKELALEFKNNIFGPHSRDLRVMLTKLRSEQPDEGNFVLVCIKPFREWMLAKKSTKRGSPVQLIPNRVFTCAAEVEWEVFKLLWQSKTGEHLS